MKLKFFILTFLFITFTLINLNAQATVNGRFVVLTNNGTIYEIKLQLNTNTGTDDFGSGNLVVNFNNLDLGFPGSPQLNTDYF